MKKHVKLYNRVFEALHEDDKFVLCLDKTHQEIVGIILEAMRDAVLSGKTNEAMAEVVLRALQDAGDEALSNDTLGGSSQTTEQANEDLRKEVGALRHRLEKESWMHAACLSIAEGVPGWDGKLADASLSMRQVQALRRAYEDLRLVVIGQCSPLVGEALPDALKRTLEELRERAD